MRTFIFITALISTIFVLGGIVLADGIIIPYPPHPPMPPYPPPYHPTEPMKLSLKYHDVDVKIEDGVVKTHVEEVFFNPYDVDLEGTYIFPLPEGAAVDEFAMYVDGEKIYAEVMDAEEARQTYEDIVRQMKDPALLEYYGKDAFRARVYPIPANGEKKIEISYSEVLQPDAGVYKYVYPLEISNFTKDPLERLKINLELESSQPLLNVYCPTYSVDIDREGKNMVSVYHEDEEVKPDKDFVLYYQVSQDKLGMSVLSYKEWGEDGYFIMNLAPRFDLDTDQRSKDIVFVFDTSGSMRGEKIEQTKEAMKYCLKSLNPSDYFSIVSFSSEVKTFSDKMVPATDQNIDNALEFIEKKEARGGTDIHSAILEAEEILASYSPELPMIVFLTDGKPTVGTTDESEMITEFKMSNETDSRIFVFGVGYDLNATLLDHIARALSGVTQYVGEGENLEVAVSNFYDKIDSPVYSDIEIDFGGFDIYKTTPRPLPDMFKGSQLIMAGRYEGEGMTTITVTAEGPDGPEVFEYPVDFDGDSEAVVSTIWARRWIGYLLEEMRVEGENDELIEEVRELALQYGIVTPYT
jgi:Ca-activated chloride channel family protein